jgi:uncharacterized DUF497 family protein
MNIKISAHAARQAALRGITEEGIRAIVIGRSSVSIPSKTDHEAVIMYGLYADKIWAVVLNFNTLNVITVRRARKVEERFYEEKRNRPYLL